MITKPKLILIGIAAVLACWGLWAILELRDAKLLAIAEEKEKIAAAAVEEKQKAEEAAKRERESHEKERQEWQEQQAALTRSVMARNEATAARIASALAPKPSEQVGKEAEKELGIKPTPTAAGFQISVQEMQEFVALKIDRDRLSDNLKETEKQLGLERQVNATLRADLDNLSKNLEQANKSIVALQDAMQAYKTVAKKSRLRKTIEFGGKAGLAVALGYLGAKAGSQ